MFQRAQLSLPTWTHHLPGISTHDGTTSCDVDVDGRAVTVVGGMDIWNIQKNLAAANRTLVGGTSMTFGVERVPHRRGGGGHSL